jgi:hypothetical protein
LLISFLTTTQILLSLLKGRQTSGDFIKLASIGGSALAVGFAALLSEPARYGAAASHNLK